MSRVNVPATDFYEETKYGFQWGCINIARACSDSGKGWKMLLIQTPKHRDKPLQVYVTKTGKVRFFDGVGELTVRRKRGKRNQRS